MRKPLQLQIEQLLENEPLPSLGAIVFDKTHIIDQGIAGVRKLGEQHAVTLHDFFHIGSNGKAMTATIIGEQVVNGRLDWHSTPLDIFPSWEDDVHPDYKSVTLLQLLSHQAGLPPFEEDVEFEALPSFEGTPTQVRAAFARHVLQQTPLHTPGSDFRYSNAGFAIATTMLEAVSGEAWESLLHGRILTPLGITGGVGWPAKANPTQPWGHVWLNGKIEPHDPNDASQMPPMLAPAGDVFVAFDEYPKFLQMNLGALDGEAIPFDAEMIRFLHEPQGKSGLGWGVQPLMGRRVSVHTGSADTFFALALLSHDDSKGICMVTNVTWEVAEKPCIALLKSLIEVYFERRTHGAY